MAESYDDGGYVYIRLAECVIADENDDMTKKRAKWKRIVHLHITYVEQYMYRARE
jgi:hypothetical protein